VSDYALDGLKQMMAVKSRVVLPYLVPQVSSATWTTLELKGKERKSIYIAPFCTKVHT